MPKTYSGIDASRYVEELMTCGNELRERGYSPSLESRAAHAVLSRTPGIWKNRRVLAPENVDRLTRTLYDAKLGLRVLREFTLKSNAGTVARDKRIKFIQSVEGIPTTYLEALDGYNKATEGLGEDDRMKVIRTVRKEHPYFSGDFGVLVTGMNIGTETVFRRNQLLKGVNPKDMNREIEERMRRLREGGYESKIVFGEKRPRDISIPTWAVFQDRNARILQLSVPIEKTDGCTIFDSVYAGPYEAFKEWLDKGASSQLTDYMNEVITIYGTPEAACFPEIIIALANGETIVVRRKEGLRRLKNLINENPACYG